MRKQMKKVTSGFLAACLMVAGITTGGVALAAENNVGSTAALTDTQYTLEEILIYAIEDEYMAKAEYAAIIEKYGEQKPFSNIIKAEDRHISMLLPLLEKYSVAVPNKDWASLVTVPESIEAAYSLGVVAEEKNIAMYESFQKEDLPDDIKIVVERLVNGSNKHLKAFQRTIDGTCTGDSQNEKSKNPKKGRGKGQGRGQGEGKKQNNESCENCTVVS